MSDQNNEITVVPPVPAPTPPDPTELDPHHVFFELLPRPSVELTPEQTHNAGRFQNALNILGPAAGGALVCPGNQVGVAEDSRCPYSAKCVYLQAQQAPQGELCPLESEEIQNRFLGWCKELGKNPLQLTESERSFVAELVWISVQEYRCTAIVSKGNDARLTQLNPKETHPETLEAISWERVIHSNVERLDQLHLQRRMLLKDWMLTPEQKWKRDKAEGKSKGLDISSKQSALADKLRKLGDTPVIDAESE
jgi:hypothetical protein